MCLDNSRCCIHVRRVCRWGRGAWSTWKRSVVALKKSVADMEEKHGSIEKKRGSIEEERGSIIEERCRHTRRAL
jgi:hypothetical protein